MSTFNGLKTAILLGALTGALLIFGRILGGQSGMLIALVFAAGMNFFAYWFSDTVVLKMHGARAVERAQAPQLMKSWRG